MKRRCIPLFVTQQNFPVAIDFTDAPHSPLSPGRRRRMLANDKRSESAVLLRAAVSYWKSLPIDFPVYVRGGLQK